jgi:hypothetical protein
MQITSKQTLIFRVPGQKDYVLRPSQHPVIAPEHIRGTQLFKLAAADGTIQEFVPVAPVDTSKAKADAEAKAKADADQADADAKAEAEAAKAKAEEKVAAEIEAAKASLAKDDKKAK